ncbi:MAG TPA: ComEC/Rec2 family competence protein, partial [Cyclobacteriaceae bacterium]|nr:ComEC/Rec2 family competence protein [Cyclobacteriaceae bacterium]
MFRWIPYAMVRVTLFFVGGILCAIRNPAPISFNFLCVGLIAFFVIYLMARRFSNLLAGAIGLSAIFCSGFIRVQLHTNNTELNEIAFYTATIVKFSEERKNSWRTEADVTATFFNGTWKKTSTRLLLYFSKKDFTKPFQYGDVLLIHGSPSKVMPPANPGEFDLQRHLHFKNIHYRHT